VTLATATDIERMHAAARQQGYAAGHAEGIAEVRRSAARIDALVTSLQQAIKEIDQNIADQLLATAVEIANRCCDKACASAGDVLPVVKEAVATLNAHLGHQCFLSTPTTRY